MLETLLSQDDARRATAVLERLLARGLAFALTGSQAIEAQLRAHNLAFDRRPLHDLDLVVQDGESLPETIAAGFLLSHIHPRAPQGKLLMQMVDPEQRVRVDVFRAYGSSLSRARRLDAETGELQVLAIEDLRARSVAQLCIPLEDGRPVDVKFAAAFRRLYDHGQDAMLAEAWNDHRQFVAGTLAEASTRVLTLLAQRADLLIVEEYTVERVPCEKCSSYAPFELARP